MDIRSGIDVYEGGGGAGCEIRIDRDDFWGAWRIGCASFLFAELHLVFSRSNRNSALRLAWSHITSGGRSNQESLSFG